MRLPVASGGATPEPPPYGGLGVEGWARGLTFLELVAAAGPARAEIEAAFAQVHVDASIHAFFAAYPRRVRVLVLGGLDAIDLRVNVAQAERLFTFGTNLWLRVFLVPQHADLRRLFTSEELPLFVFFGDDRREFARWGPRPQALRDAEAAAPGLDAAQQEASRRAFYAHSRSAALAGDLQRLLAAHAG